MVSETFINFEIFFLFLSFPGILEFWCLATVTFKFTVLYNNIYREKIFIYLFGLGT